MQTQLEAVKEEGLSAIDSADTLAHLQDIKAVYLGKTGKLTDVLKQVKDLPNEQKPVIGKLANIIKTALLQAVDAQVTVLEAKKWESKFPVEDITMPETHPPTPSLFYRGGVIGKGHVHPIHQMQKRLEGIFSRLGFAVAAGPEIEDDFHNFEALNIPADHPARDMHDTFYLDSGEVLRTHTSPVQIRYMKEHTPPARIIAPGKVYRYDSDVSHSPVFHQIEGLYVDKNVSFAELKWVLQTFMKELFGSELKFQFRPSYFPFTEPSCEVDISCVLCEAKGCSVCKRTGWLEVMGAGMVNPQVFRAVGWNPDDVKGFAFGVGVDRLAMLYHRISDIRLLYENDLRFLRQF